MSSLDNSPLASELASQAESTAVSTLAANKVIRNNINDWKL